VVPGTPFQSHAICLNTLHALRTARCVNILHCESHVTLLDLDEDVEVQPAHSSLKNMSLTLQR
jgi:hypothetical protein